MRFAWVLLILLTVGALLIPQSGGAQNGPYTLTVTVKGDGRVTSVEPPIDCPGTCTAEAPAGVDVALVATPNTNQRFEEWRDDCQGAGDCRVTMSENRTVEARFTGETGSPTVTTTTSPTSTTTASPTATGSPTQAAPTQTPGVISAADRRRARALAQELARAVREEALTIARRQRFLRAGTDDECSEGCQIQALLGGGEGTASTKADERLKVKIKLKKKLRKRITRNGKTAATLRLSVTDNATGAVGTVERELSLRR